MAISRRGFFVAGLCGCALCWGGQALARAATANSNSNAIGNATGNANATANAKLPPLIGPGYQPVDADEKGMWQQCERLEEEIAASSLLMQTPDLRGYTVQVVERLIDAQAKDLRVYLVHDPAFNAAMFPNGMMLVNSGFLARVRSEAQFAAVLGHEAGHYARRHSVSRWRDLKAKTGFMAFLSAGTAVAAGASAASGGNPNGWIDLANSVNSMLVLSLFSFSRAHEGEADLYGLRLLSEAGYTPDAAAQVWRQLIGERKASAAERGKRYRDHARSAYSTHPPTDERLGVLGAAAAEVFANGPERDYADGRDSWQRAIAPHRAALLDEQVKLNDPGASLYLVTSLAQDGWTGTLRFYEGEIYRLRDETGDAERAASAYAAAVGFDDAPPEAWRAHGYAQLKAGRGEEGRRALSRYLDLKPDAKDAGMVRFSLLQ